LHRASAAFLGVALIAFLLLPSASAQTVQYGHTLGGAGTEEGRIIGVDGSGNVYQFGTTSSYSAGAFLAKRDPRGDVQWQRILDFGGSLAPVGIAVAPDGTVYFAGQFGGNSTAGTIVGKILSDGTLAFSKFTTALISPNAIAFDPVSGGALITGAASWSPPSGGLFSIDASGTVRWAAFVNGTVIPYTATFDDNGTAFVATTQLFNGRTDAGIIAFSATGAVVGAKRLNLPDDEYGWSITRGPDGDLYYLGFSYPSYDPIFARLTTNLVPQWTEYGGSPSLYDYCWRIVSRGDGTYYAQGDYYNYSAGQSGSVTYRLDSTGAIVDSSLLPSTGPGGSYLHIQDIAAAPDGSVLLSGTSYRSPPRVGSPVGDARVLAITASWVTDSAGWYGTSLSPTNLSGTLTDPNFAADDFRVEVQDQAWYGAIVLPSSPVTAIASANVTNPDNRTVAFSANVTGGTPPYTYRWSFGDANSSAEASPIHAYSEGGRYPAQLVVEDSAGNRAYSIVDVLLGGPPVITSMSISPNPTYLYQYTSFYATGDDPDGTIVNWHWDFGDGSTWDSSYSNAYHFHYALGTYNVTVTARDNDGLETTASMLLQVVDQPPRVCSYVYPNPTVVGYPTNFQDCSYDPDGYIVSSVWDFGDGAQANGSYVTHAYATAATFVVRLTVTDNSGSVATQNQTVYVNVNQPPVARFAYSPSDPIAGQYVYFNGWTSYDPDGYIVLWTWDFGDGTNQTNYYGDTYHYYPRGGRYTVTLTVTDNFYGKNSTSVSLYVDIPPIASFTTDRDFGKVGTFLRFDASASNDPDGRIVRYEWNFGDGGNFTAGGPIVSHVFAATGTYTVTLIVWDDHNATSTFLKTISVVPPKSPFAILAFTPSRPFVGDAVSFNASLSSDPDGTIVRYVWQLGDGAVGEGATLTHRYAYPGTYTVHLTVVDEDGIAVTTSSEITAVSRPVAAFSVAPTTIHAFEDVMFTANGSWDLTGSLVYHWDFGDGTYGEGWQTTKQYSAAGTYHVTLNVTNPFGVSATVEKDITVDAARPVTASGVANEMILVSLLIVVVAAGVAITIYTVRRIRTLKPPPGTP
jgi:PKD repeat protein